MSAGKKDIKMLKHVANYPPPLFFFSCLGVLSGKFNSFSNLEYNIYIHIQQINKHYIYYHQNRKIGQPLLPKSQGYI